MKAKDLADALETSERTVYRDIETLCESGIPISSDFGPTGGFTLMEGYTAGLKIMNCDEAVALYLSGIASRQDTGATMRSTLNSLQSTLPEEYAKDIRKAINQFYFDPENWFVRKKPVIFLDVLRQAIWQSVKLDITYRKSSLGHEETVHRRIHPYGLVVKNNEWYLVAYCETSKGIRVYRCDRLLKAELVNQIVTLPEGFSLERFWQEWVVEFTDIIRDEHPPLYMVKIKAEDSFDGREYDIVKSEQFSGYKIITLNMNTFEEACGRSLQLSVKSEILSPTELRDYAIQQAKSILERHGNHC